MTNLFLIYTISIIGIISGIIFSIFIIYLILDKNKEANKIILSYIWMAAIACGIYGFLHNIMVNPVYFNSILSFNFQDVRTQVFLIVWGWRAALYFLIFALWLRIIIIRSRNAVIKKNIFHLLVLHAVLVSTAWILDFEKLFMGITYDYHYFLHWIGGITACFMIIIIDFIFLEKKILDYIKIKDGFLKIRGKLLIIFSGATVLLLFELFGILIGCINIDTPPVLVIKMLIFSIIFILPLIFVITKITKDFSSNLSQSVSYIQKAAKQDFTEDLNIVSYDEFGSLNESLEIMKNNFQNIFSTVKTSAKQVEDSAISVNNSLENLVSNLTATFKEFNNNAENNNKASIESEKRVTEVTNQIKDIDNNIKSQSNMVEKNLHNIEKMSSTLNEVTIKTKNASQISTKFYELSTDGKNKIEKTIESIKEIEKSSNKINEINIIIDNISNKIRLLSINAGIESAQSGDYGKGFSVIAQEMKKLAENSTKNANLISNLIKEILNRIVSTAGFMDNSKDSFMKIFNYSEDIKIINDEIANIMIEENTNVQDVYKTTSDIVNATKEISKSSDYIKNSTDEINRSFIKMKDISQEEKVSIEKNDLFIKDVIKVTKEIIKKNIDVSVDLKKLIENFKV